MVRIDNQEDNNFLNQLILLSAQEWALKILDSYHLLKVPELK